MSLRLRFGDFELDVAAYELRRHGRACRLERQPMDLLIMLVERRGLLVTRGDTVYRLWGKDVFVDVETGVHTAIRKIRQALRDSAEEPVCIETVSGKGYRFIAPVEVVGAESPPAPADSVPAAVVAAPARARIGLGLVAVVALAGIIAWAALGRDSQPSSARLAVLPFENLSGDPSTLEALSRERFVPPYAMALVHAGLGERDLAFEWLDRAFDAHDVHLIFLTVDPKWDPYRADSRFEALLARCGFPGPLKPAS